MSVADDDSTKTINVPLGYLRGFVVLLVIAHHASLAYAQIMPAHVPTFTGPGLLWRAFPIIDPMGVKGLQLFSSFNDIFFMSLLFMLSGVFVSHSIARKGRLAFLRDRIIRLGIPFAIGSASLAPLAYFAAFAQITGTMDVATFWREWTSLPVWPSGPVWFIWVLLAFDTIAFVLFVIAPGWANALGKLGSNADRKPFLFFLLLVVLSALAYGPMSAIFGSSSWWEWHPLTFQTSRIIHYFVYFVIGVGLGAFGTERGLFDPEGRLAKFWWLWIIIAAVAFVVIGTIVIVAIGAKGQPPMLWAVLGGIGFALSCAASSFALLAIFLNFFKRRSALLDSLRDNSYGIYLFHYALVSWLLYALLPIALPPLAKFGIVFAGAAASAWILTLLLRRIPVVRRII